MTLDVGHGEADVLLVPGGGSTVHGYFPQLAAFLGTYATVIEIDPPGIDISSDRRWLRLSDYAFGLGQAVRREGDNRVVVVGHSLGGLVALRLAVEEPDLVAGLLLLDPAPLMPPPVLRSIAVFLNARAGLGAVGRRLRGDRARRDLHGVPSCVERERAVAVHTPPRSVPKIVRLAWYLVCDGPALAADLRAGKLDGVPTIVVSAGEHAPKSLSRRTHERFVEWIPGAELRVWEGTGHALHIERPHRVAEAVLALLERAASPC